MVVAKKHVERQDASLDLWKRWPLSLVARFFAEDAWRRDRVQSGNLLFRIARVGFLAARGFFKDNCLFRASALTYITVLSLVPLLAFSFSVAKGFGFYHDLLKGTIDPFLDRTFGPLATESTFVMVTDSAPEMRSAIDRVLRFVEATDVSALGFFGLALLLFTVVKLLGTIERSFNDIWGVQRSRSLVRKLSDYLAMVVVTPIFLFVAAGATGALQNSALQERWALSGIVEVLLKVLPVLSLWAGFTFIYMALPNTKTRFGSALLGALVAGFLMQAALLLHLKFQIGIARYNAIYSSFAAVPIFLVWVNMSWIIVLLGAEIAFAHQSEPSYAHVTQSELADHAFKERLGLRAMTRIGQSFLEGTPPRTAASLAQELSAPQMVLEEVLYVFVDHHLLVVSGDAEEARFLPARDLESLTVKTILDALKGTSGHPEKHAGVPVDEHIDRILTGLAGEFEGSRHNRTLRSLAEAAGRRTASASPDVARTDTGFAGTAAELPRG